MQFSQPVKIGNFYVQIQRPTGFYIEGATSNNGTRYTKVAPYTNDYGYDKGVAIFGNGNDVIYVHYNYSADAPEKFGDKNISNTIDIHIGHGGDIFQIKTNSGMVFYYISFGYKYGFFYIIGKRQDGKWIKYIYSPDIDDRYFGKNLYWSDAPMYVPFQGATLSCQNDTIIIPYHILKTNSKGEMRFKWDEKAQWFSVEQIKY